MQTQNEPQVDLVEDLAEQLSDTSSWMPEALKPAWAFLQKYPELTAILLVVVGYFAAKLIVFVLKKTLHQLTKRTKTDFDDLVIEHLSKPVFASIFYGFLALAVISLQLSSASLTNILLKLIATLVILFWMNAAFPLTGLILSSVSKHKDKLPLIEDRTLPLFDMICKVIVVLITSYALLQVWNIDATAWLASAGVVGIAVGFAAKDTLANLFSGVFIVADAPYTLGDFIQLDSGERGMVTHVGLRSTRLLTRDDVEVTIPNAVMANTKIVNESSGRWTKCRIRIKVGVAYGSDLDQVCTTLIDIANQHAEICKSPEARVRLRAFGGSSVDFELLVWIEEPVLKGKVSHELMLQIYQVFDEHGIEIPYSKQDLYIKEMPATHSEDPV